MRYLGGKFRIRRWVADVVAQYPGRWVWEPFCGGLNSAAAHDRPVLCSDASEPLIALYRAVAAGWDPPQFVSREEFYLAKSLPVSDPMHGFCAFGCSFGGSYFGGYAANDQINDYAGASRRAVLRDVGAIKDRGGMFGCFDFCSVEPEPLDAVIYCDPPYFGTTGYGVDFDRELFLERCRQWARYTTVLVSEFDLPIGRVVAELERSRCLRRSDGVGTAVERIYLIEP